MKRIVLFLIAFEGVAFADTKTECIASADHAIALRTSGKLIDARAELVKCGRRECPGVVKEDCGTTLASIDQRIPSIVVSVIDEQGHDVLGAEVVVDDAPFPVDGRAHALDPGAHVFRSSIGDNRASETVIVREGEQARSIQLRIDRRHPLPPAAEHRAFWVFPAVPIGLAALGVVGLSVAGGLRVDLDSRLDDSTCAPVCSSAHRASLSSELVAGNALLIGGIAALVIAAGSYFFLKPASHHDGRASMR